MKTLRCFIIMILYFYINNFAFAQSGSYECVLPSSGSSRNQMLKANTRTVAKTGTIKAMAIYAVPNNATSDLAPIWIGNIDNVHNFMSVCSFGLFNLQITVIKKDSLHCFRSDYNMPHDYIFNYQDFVRNVLEQVDSVYDLGQNDNDGPDGIPNSGDDDGYVDAVFFNIINYPDTISQQGTANALVGGDWTSRDTAYIVK
jgi:hypothetical protein